MSGPLPTVANALRADFIWSSSGDVDVQTKTFFKYSGGAPSASDCTSLASDLFTAMAAEFGSWGADVSLTQCIVTDLSSHTGGQGNSTGTTSGGKTTARTALGQSLLINFHIARRYRGSKRSEEHK